MTTPKRKIYRRKPKTLEDKILGKGLLGDIAHGLFFVGIAAGLLFAGSVGVIYLTGSFVTGAGVIFGTAVTGSFLAAGLATGRIANILDDNHKANRYDKFVKKSLDRLDSHMEGMEPEERLEYLKKERLKNKIKIAEIEKHFSEREELKKLEREEELRLREKDASWIERLGQHAKIEEVDELEAVTRA